MSRENSRPSTTKFRISTSNQYINYTSVSCLVTPKHKYIKYIPLSKYSSRELPRSSNISRENLPIPKPHDENLIERSLIVSRKHRESKLSGSRSHITSPSDISPLPLINTKDRYSQLCDISTRYSKRMLPIDNILIPKYKTILEQSDNFLTKLYQGSEVLPKSRAQSRRENNKFIDEEVVGRSFLRDESPSLNPIKSISITTKHKRKPKQFNYDLITIQPFESTPHARSSSVPKKFKEAASTETQTDLDSDSELFDVNKSINYSISEGESAEEESPTVRYKSRYHMFK